ncbi:MAG TPA: 50S ribosomal protein L4, partial [Gemmatimonadaceae bacterium]
ALVSGSGKKPWRQKGTGRARVGEIRNPLWRKGGTVFGPQPRSYAQYVPKQVRALARKSALNARARDGMVFVVDRFEYDGPKTARMAALVERMGLGGRKVLVLTDGVKPDVYLSGRNLPTVHVMPYSDVSTYHVLWSDAVVIEAGALGQTLEPVAEQEPAADAAPKRSAAKTAAKPAAKKATKKAAAPKGAATKRAKSGGASASSAKKSPAKKKTAAKKASAKPSTKKPKGE